MAGGRKRQRPAEDDVLEDQNTEQLPRDDTTADPPGGARRAEMANLARRRAAHFAHFNDGGDAEDAGNVHAGGNLARNLGPWSSAVELVNEREHAAQRRKAKLQDGGGNEDQPGSSDAPAWQPSRNPDLGPRQACPVQPLRSLCEQLLVSYIDCVESLCGVPDAVRTTLSAAVCARRCLTPEVALCFGSDAPADLVLPDCSQLDRPAMVSLIKQVVTPRLQRLELGMCGRGFGDNSIKRQAAPGSVVLHDEAADVFAAAAGRCPGGLLPGLTHLTLTGAYRLNDEGLLQVLRVLPGLTHLAVPDASRLTQDLLQHLPRVTPALRHLDASNCRGFDGPSIALHVPQLPQLQSLVLDGVQEVDDKVLRALATCSNLSHVSLGYCPEITDAGVTALAAGLPGLLSLKLDKCEKVTDASLQALGSSCPKLKSLLLMRVPKVSDAGLTYVIQRRALEKLTLHGATHVTDATMVQLATYCHSTLNHLDISFCRMISNEAMGHLVDRCNKLATLIVFGCSQLTRTFAYGHSNDSLLCEGLGTGVTAGA